VRTHAFSGGTGAWQRQKHPRKQQMKRNNASHCCFEMRPFVRKDSLVADAGVSLCDTALTVNSCTVFLYLCRFIRFVSNNTGVVFILINIFVPSILHPTSPKAL